MMLEVTGLGAPSDARDGAPTTVSGLAPFLAQELGARIAVLTAWAKFEAAECN
jgi:hypothetical protein